MSFIVSGIPTEPDVNRLLETFKVPEAGTVIKHSDVSAIINIKPDHHRYRVVTNAWRKKLYRDHNIILGPVKSIGFKSLAPDDRAGFIGSKYKSGIRQVKRSHSVAVRTDLTGMTPESKRVVNHVKHTAAALVLADATAAKQLPPIS